MRLTPLLRVRPTSIVTQIMASNSFISTPAAAHLSSSTATSKPSEATSSSTTAAAAPKPAESAEPHPQFGLGTLSLADLAPSPFAQFHTWYGAAAAAAVPQPYATTLATAALPVGRVSARMVYLERLDAHGFVVYSNWGTSRKAADVASNPHAALVFWWREQERQVRVEGAVQPLPRPASQAYFDSRPRPSRLGAWASRQSEALPGGGRDLLDQRVREEEARWQGSDKIDVPDYWGGVRVVPDLVEFWQGRDSRLHDRFVYTKVDGTDEWKIERLSP